MEAICSSETLLVFHQTTRRYIAEYITLVNVHKPRHERYMFNEFLQCHGLQALPPSTAPLGFKSN
jgi:hypothetical protein